MLFLKNWREFLEGGNDIWVFLKKGKHPHRAESRKQRAEQEEQSRKSRAGGRKEE